MSAPVRITSLFLSTRQVDRASGDPEAFGIPNVAADQDIGRPALTATFRVRHRTATSFIIERSVTGPDATAHEVAWAECGTSDDPARANRLAARYAAAFAARNRGAVSRVEPASEAEVCRHG